MQLVTAKKLQDEAKYLRLLVYGEPGTGKTWFGASAALDKVTAPVLYLEYRAQITSVMSNPEYKLAIEAGNLIILRLQKYKELDKIYHWLKNGRGSYPSLDKVMKKFLWPSDLMPKTIVIDSVTELQRTEVMRRAGNKEKFLVDIETPLIQHWGQLLNQFTTLAHFYYNLPYNMIFMGLEDVQWTNAIVGQAAVPTGYRIALQGSAQRQFPGYALTVMRMERAAKGATYFNKGVTSSSIAKTKEQSGYIPKVVPNPTIPKLVKYLKGGVK